LKFSNFARAFIAKKPCLLPFIYHFSPKVFNQFLYGHHLLEFHLIEIFGF